MIKRICKTCGKEFYAKLSEIKKGFGKYCSRKCCHKGISTKQKRICGICKKSFWAKPSDIKRGGGKYCSQKCSGLALSKSKRGYKQTKRTKEKLSNARRGKYLGENSSNWKGGISKKDIKKICKICGKEFYTTIYAIQNGFGKLCSHRCKGIWTIKHQKTKDTSIELAIEAELIKQNIPYLKQSPVEGIALVDFLLPNKIIIQCDGDYWHSLQKVKNRDANQDFALGFRGYKIYRFSGTEIRKSASRCIERIKEIPL